MTLFWFLPLAAVLHIAEEFVLPGGFRIWYQKYRPAIASSLTTRFLVITNITLVVMCILPVLMGTTTQSVALWLTIVAILFSNSLFHVTASIKSRRYSPGIITSVIFYIPLTFWGYWFFLSTSQASTETAIFAFALGSLYQWWSLYNHRRRARIHEGKAS